MSSAEIKKILENSKTIAMVGVSSEKKGEDPKNLKRKPANVVMKYMQDFGYKVIPVNPFAKGEVINGETVVDDIENISIPIDIVDVFRPSNEAPGIAEKTKKIGSKVILMNSKEHDEIFSITSHLPHLIAYNLVKTATDFEKRKKYNLIKYSAGGLRDFSRIAASNEIMWRDVFFSNQKNIIFAINLFIKNLNLFKNDIRIKNSDRIIKKLINTKKVRKKIIKLKQDINKPDFGRS